MGVDLFHLPPSGKEGCTHTHTFWSAFQPRAFRSSLSPEEEELFIDPSTKEEEKKKRKKKSLKLRAMYQVLKEEKIATLLFEVPEVAKVSIDEQRQMCHQKFWFLFEKRVIVIQEQKPQSSQWHIT